MHIVIDARLASPEQGGIGRYISELISQLTHQDRTNKYSLLLRHNNWDSVKNLPANFQKVLADIPWYSWREQVLLPSLLHSLQPDLVHFPHWNLPLTFRGRFVVTIHDLILLHFPSRQASTLGPLRYYLKNLAFRRVLRHAVNNAAHIICPSEFTRQDIHTSFRIPLKKISVTALGVTSLPTATTTPAATVKKYGISKPYALYVGVAYPHKNLSGLLAAWQTYQRLHGKNHQLVLVGRRNYFYEQLFKQHAEMFVNGSVIFTDFVPDIDLPALYQGAKLYVFPSLYEGFGLPPLEAMQYGVPVLSSNRTCLPEVLQGGATYVDPTDPAAFATALHRALTDNQLRSTLIKNGYELYPHYSWAKLTTKTISIYQNSV